MNKTLPAHLATGAISRRKTGNLIYLFIEISLHLCVQRNCALGNGIQGRDLFFGMEVAADFFIT